MWVIGYDRQTLTSNQEGHYILRYTYMCRRSQMWYLSPLSLCRAGKVELLCYVFEVYILLSWIFKVYIYLFVQLIKQLSSQFIINSSRMLINTLVIIFEMIRALHRIYRASNIRERIRLQRQTRLAKGIDARTLTTKSQDDLSRIRNIGIIAHIDAGKTTTTQRMLYYAGALPSPGNIDQGTTAMDYLAQERERGITIRSAAISFNWNEHQVNLIDTPGHVDFSGEVARSLRVLDGVVTILDAVKGVEAQTQKVFAQATKHKIPKICFLNKMDRIGSSADQSVDSLRKKLGIQPLVLQAPVGDGDSFKGVIDLIELEQFEFLGKYGEQVQKTKLQKNTQKHTHMLKLREKLVEAVGNFDDQIADMYLKQEYVQPSRLKTAIRKILLNPEHAAKVSPVLLGASFRNLGVQPLLDAILSYLPSPQDREAVQAIDNSIIKRSPSRTQPFLGYVFKVMFDIEKGPLAYTRIYSGHLTKNLQLFNSSKKLSEKVGQVLRVRANHYVPIHEISAGDIVALSGLRQTVAGDTLTVGSSDQFLLQNLDIPNPVFSAPFELESNKLKREFDEAMNRSVVQDTSLSFLYQPQTNQYLVSGLGELHLQILRDRLVGEGIPVKMGSLKINFKQTISTKVQKSLSIKKQLKPTIFEQFNLTLVIAPLRNEEGKIQKKNQVIFTFEKVPEFDQCWAQFCKKKIIAKNPRERSNFSKDQLSKMKKYVRNPTPLQPIEEQIDPQGEDAQIQEMVPYNENDPNNKNNEQQQSQDEEDDKKQSKQQPYYHMNTLPFESLYELVQLCNTSLMYGKNKLPSTGIQLQIKDGKYKRLSYSKSVMNRCASNLIRSMLDTSTVLIEPIMEFTVEGDQAMIDVAIKDILKKRGRVTEQSDKKLTGFIPAEGVRGWISQVRAMGLEIELKFSDYEEVIGVNPEKLLAQDKK